MNYLFKAYALAGATPLYCTTAHLGRTALAAKSSRPLRAARQPPACRQRALEGRANVEAVRQEVVLDVLLDLEAMLPRRFVAQTPSELERLQARVDALTLAVLKR